MAEFETGMAGSFQPAWKASRRLRAESMKVSRDFKVSIVDAPGADAYPISSFTWIVVPLRSANDATRNALTGFLQRMLGPGQRQAAALGYLPLPKDVAIKEEAAIVRIH
jgi:phosphate transport system substrate-binding protein